MALISAMAFALNVACGPLIYAGGGNIHAINYLRPVAFLACVVIWMMLARRSFRLPSMQLSGAVALGGILCIEFYAVFSAVKFMPVGLAILVMYTYPLVVSLIEGFTGRSRLSVWLIVGLLVSFAGLALALGTPEADVAWQGIALAFVAMLGMCGLVMISERTMDGYDRSVVMFYTMATASVVMAAMYLTGIDPVWPQTLGGLTALAVTTMAYIVATFFLFISISMIGPVRFAVIDNTAPVWAALFGVLLLGESLEPIQWLGIAMVVGGVVAVQFLHGSPPEHAVEPPSQDAIDYRY